MAAMMSFTNKLVNTTGKYLSQDQRLFHIAAIRVSSISTFSNDTASKIIINPSTKISNNYYLSSNRFPRTNFITMSNRNYNTETVAEITNAWTVFLNSKLHAYAEGGDKVITEFCKEAVEITKAIEECGEDLGLESWFLAFKLHEKGGNPYEVIQYYNEALEMFEYYKDRGVIAPIGIVHGWPFAIALVNLIIGSMYHYYLKLYGDSWSHLLRAESIFESQLPQDERVRQILLETQREQLKLQIIEEKTMTDVDCSGQCKAVRLIYSQLDEDDEALEQIQIYKNILQNTAQTTCDLLKGTVDRSDRLIDLERYEEAIEVLESVVSQDEIKGGERAIALVSMARALVYQSKFADAKKYMETACQILEEDEMPATYIIVGFWVMSAFYEKMNEYETAISLMRRVPIIPTLPMRIFVQGSETFCSLMSQIGGYKKTEILGLRDFFPFIAEAKQVLISFG